MNEKISVIIPVFNRSALIRRAVDSVLSQSLPPDEIIVVDDGSTDDTLRILKNYERKIKIIAQKNRGVSTARNAGIREAKGDWVALLDSDDEWLPKKLEYAVEYIRNNPAIKIFQCEEIWIRNGKRVNPKIKHKKLSGNIFKESLPLCIISPSAVIIKKEIFSKVGLFDETLPVCEDYDLWLRITKRFTVGLDPRAGVIKYGGHADQLSHAYAAMDIYRIKAMEKHLDDENLRRFILPEIIKKLKIVINGAQKRQKDVDRLQEKLHKYNAMMLENF